MGTEESLHIYNYTIFKNPLNLAEEVKELSAYIATLKRKLNSAKDINEKDRLTEEIKIRQYQALFYLEKMENVNKSIKESNEQL